MSSGFSGFLNNIYAVYFVVGLALAYFAYYLKGKNDAKKESSPSEMSWWWWVVTILAIWLVGASVMTFVLFRDPNIQQGLFKTAMLSPIN